MEEFTYADPTRRPGRCTRPISEVEMTVCGPFHAEACTAPGDLAFENAVVQRFDQDEGGSVLRRPVDVCTHIKDHGVYSAPHLITSTSTQASLRWKTAKHLPESVEGTFRSCGKAVDNTYRYGSTFSMMKDTQADTAPSHIVGTYGTLAALRSSGFAVQCLHGDEESCPIEFDARGAQRKNDGTHFPLYTRPIVTWTALSFPSTSTHSPAESKSIHFNPQASMRAATLPQELFSIIIDAAGSLYREDYRACRDLGSCPLVCVYWASRFRPLAYGGRNIIRSEEKALQLRDLVLGACSDRLTPLVKLVGWLEVRADPTARRSWHHVLTALAPLIPVDKFAEIDISGNWQSLSPFRSLSWGIPSVSALPYRKLSLSHLHFETLQHLVQLVRKLPRLQVLHIKYLKWDADAPRGNTTPRQQARSALTRVRVLCCQDASLLLLRLLLVGSARVANPLQVLPPAEQAVIIQLITASTNAQPSRFDGGAFNHRQTLSACSDISSSSISLRMPSFIISLHFYYKCTVIGCAVTFTKVLRNYGIDLSAIASDNMWSTLPLFPDLRYLVIGFSDVSSVQVLVRRHRALWTSLGRQLRYFRFASQREAGEKKEWIAHVPGSLEMTGEKWTEVYWHEPNHGEALNNIVSAQMEANPTTLNHRE